MSVKQRENEQAIYLGQPDEIEEPLEAVASILRWLWTTNFLAAAAGIGMHLYWMTAVTGISSVVSLVGVAVLRRAVRKMTRMEIRHQEGPR